MFYETTKFSRVSIRKKIMACIYIYNIIFYIIFIYISGAVTGHGLAEVFTSRCIAGIVETSLLIRMFGFISMDFSLLFVLFSLIFFFFPPPTQV